MRESAERSVVAVVPHPDDESYSAAGALALAADSGVRVCLICATRGERGNVEADPSNELARARTAELVHSCRTIGLGTPLWLDLPDGAVDEHIGDGTSRLVPLLASLAPGVIVTLGSDGAYGHRDHLAVTEIVRQSVARLRPRIRDGLRVLHSAFPRGVFDGVYDFHASVPTLRRLLAAPPADGFGTDRAAVDLVIDVSRLRRRKLSSIAAHESQLMGRAPERLFGDDRIEPLLREEWFTLASGPPLPPGCRDLAGALARPALD